MNLLLDTHAFLWWIDDNPMPPLASEAIRNPENAVWLSAASAWEITIKVSLGKLRLPDRAARFIEAQRQRNAFGWLPVDVAALDILQDLPFHHRDPFDRLLIAQAVSLGYTLVSADSAFGQYPVRTLWS
ncbi:MAG: type II toxin-antitoxin system VapC family toxin [Candidatus Accumulibacter sp.]|uniref:Type II toxin-antitoxin system VapC family toxin n=1 Tax=Candidatus Accumulibacter proximus TaxID=2954385 RepID=A0A935PZ11_9PROT|nr:type II toxin-antitoxin system VapC family toxin [Candidatus Accumulibacter proximus]